MSLEISLLLDGQLPLEQTKDALGDIAAGEDLRDRFTVYGLIGDVLRGNSTPDDGFSTRLLERMRREGVSPDPDFDPLAGR